MDISRSLAIKILKYLSENKDFYFPFWVVCKEYSDEDNDFVEISPDEWGFIAVDKKYKTFQLWENLQNLDEDTLKFMSKGFLERITNNSLEKHITQLAKNYRKECNQNIWKGGKVEEFGLNEFIEGKADAFEDCLYLIKKYQNFYSK